MRYKQRDRTQDLKVQKQMCAEGFEGNDNLKVTRAALNRMMCVLYCTYFDGYDKDNHLWVKKNNMNLGVFLLSLSI